MCAHTLACIYRHVTRLYIHTRAHMRACIPDDLVVMALCTRPCDKQSENITRAQMIKRHLKMKQM